MTAALALGGAGGRSDWAAGRQESGEETVALADYLSSLPEMLPPAGRVRARARAPAPR